MAGKEVAKPTNIHVDRFLKIPYFGAVGFDKMAVMVCTFRVQRLSGESYNWKTIGALFGLLFYSATTDEQLARGRHVTGWDGAVDSLVGLVCTARSPLPARLFPWQQPPEEPPKVAKLTTQPRTLISNGPRTERLYVLRAVGTNLVKVGRAKDVKLRLKSLQTGCPHPLVVCLEADVSIGSETRIHRRLAHLNTTGEWFRLTDEARRVFKHFGEWHEGGINESA